MKSKIRRVNSWRNYIICLLLVTLPSSLWAAIAIPAHCELQPPAGQVQAERVQEDSHAHHDMGSVAAADEAQDQHHPMPDSPNLPCDCCGGCLASCLASTPSVLSLQAIPLESAATSRHFSKTHASQLLAGPSYPSLYRPPIFQI